MLVLTPSHIAYKRQCSLRSHAQNTAAPSINFGDPLLIADPPPRQLPSHLKAPISFTESS